LTYNYLIIQNNLCLSFYSHFTLHKVSWRKKCWLPRNIGKTQTAKFLFEFGSF